MRPRGRARLEFTGPAPGARPTVVVVVVAAAGLAGLVGWLVGSPTVASSGPGLTLVAGAEWRRREVAARARAEVEGLAPSIDRLIGHLRSGRSLVQACLLLDQPGPGQAGPALAPLVAALRRHHTLAEAAGTLVGHADPSVQLLGVSLGVLARNGGPAVPALQRLRHTLIGLHHSRRRAEAEAAQAMASAGLLVAAPGAFAVVVALVEPAAAHLYLFEPLGAACVGAALGLSSVGWWWMRRAVAAGAGGRP